jgi:uncharacterized protein (DUF2235 family)
VRLFDRVRNWVRPPRVEVHSPEPHAVRGSVDHVVILDGTMSSLVPGHETNAGLTYRLMRELTPSARLSVYYEAGIQMHNWRDSKDVLEGRGINRQIRRAYGFLASRYHPGDRIFLFGYSRGAYAVRSLAGVIDRIGLLKAEEATVRNVVQAYRHYQLTPDSDAARAFSRLYCHDEITIEMVGVWDTVKALGLPVPFLRRFMEPRHAFHNHQLGPVIRRGFHALALDETRVAFSPVLWNCPEEWQGRVEQVWFRGAHGDVGGMLGGVPHARPLANIPLVWMLDKAEGCGLMLPYGWRERFPCDASVPMMGTWSGVGKLFLHRGRRQIGQDRSETVHASAADWYHRRHVAKRSVVHLFRDA